MSLFGHTSVLGQLRPYPANAPNRALVGFAVKPYSGTMGRFWYPFVAASAVLLIMMIAGMVFGPTIYWRQPHGDRMWLIPVLVALCCVVVYAVMRARTTKP
jgi:hypothetical protein